MRYVLFVFGILAVVIGISTYGWLLYNVFWPTKEFRENAAIDPIQYLFPAIMIAIGFKWILGIRKRPTPTAPAPTKLP